MTAPREDIRDMTREQLIEMQGHVSAQLRQTRGAIDHMRRTARAAGRFADPSELRDLETKRHVLTNLVSKISAELAKRRGERQQRTGFEARFVAAARDMLAPDTFEAIRERAGMDSPPPASAPPRAD